MTGRRRDPARDFVASVVIPAHNEEAVIGRLLDALNGGPPVEVVVACNGCRDATATIAREHGARVIEIDRPSKIAALNAGDAAATVFPRLYVDADVVPTPDAVADVARALTQPGALCASPPVRVAVDGHSWPLRAYYAVWTRNPFLEGGLAGSGVYGLSAAGRRRFEQFPDVIADDLFVRNLFTRSERIVVATDPVVVEAPRTLRALVRRRVRVYAGNLELAAHPGLPPQPGAAEAVDAWWRPVIHQPRLVPAAVCYAAVNVVAKVAARRAVRRNQAIGWGRDDTTRVAASSPGA